MKNISDKPLLQNKPKKQDDVVEVESSGTKTSVTNTFQPGQVKEIGGREHGLEPTRYGDWEFKGRCIDF